MKRIIRLTESDLARIVRRVISEGPQHSEPALMDVYEGITVSGFFGPNDKVNLQAKMRNYDRNNEAKIFNATVTLTTEGVRAGLKPSNFTLPTFPISQYPISNQRAKPFKSSNGKQYLGEEKIINIGFTAPTTSFKNNTGKSIKIATINFNTNSSINPEQIVTVFLTMNSQFGVSGAQSKS